jgi:hypothetical protein
MNQVSVVLLGLVIVTIGNSGCEATSVDHSSEITDLLEALPEAWNGRDAAMWVSNFESSSDFTNIPTGSCC